MKPIAAFVVMLSLCSSVAAQTPSNTIRILLLTPFVNYSFFDTVKKGAADAAKAMNVELTFSGTPDGNVEALAKMIGQGVKDGYDGIGVNILDPVAYDEAIAQAIKKGVPVIAFNVDDSRTPNARLAAIGQNMLQAGRAFGKAVAPLIPQGAHVLLTQHDPHISALEDRARGVQESLKAKGIIWATLFTGTDLQRAIQKVHAALQADPRIKVILSTGTADTEAAGLVLEKFYPQQGYVAAGFDLSPEILRLVKTKVIHLTVDQQPYALGFYAVTELALLHRYGLVPSNIDTGAVIIDVSQADRVIELSKQHYR